MDSSIKDNSESIGGGIITMSILSMLVAIINIYIYIGYLEIFDKLNNSIGSYGIEKGTDFPTSGLLYFTIFSFVVFILGTIIILLKKTIGIAIYYISTIAIIFSILIGFGLSGNLIRFVILPILMWKFISSQSHLFT